jgi:hypothetical protein
MNFRRKVAITAVVLLAGGGLTPVATAHADQLTNLYVSTSSSCNNSGPGTEARPFCTIQAAANAVNPGQTVLVEPGIYLGPATLSRSGNPGAPITFESATPRSGINWNTPVTIENTGSTTATVLTLADVHDVRISGITVQGNLSSGIDVTGSHDITLDTDDVTGGTTTTHGIAIDGSSSGIVVTRTAVTNSGGAFQLAAGAGQVTIADDIMAVTRGQVISATGVSGLSVTGNTVAGASCEPAIGIAGGSTGVTVENNVVRGYAADPSACAALPLLSVAPDSTSGVNVGFNAWSAVAPRFDYSWGTTNYTTAAAFAAGVPGQGGHDIDIPTADVTPAPAEGSPLIDSADASAPGEAVTDFYGNPRADDPNTPNTGTGGGFVDRGAVEREDTLSLAPTYSPATPLGAAPYTFSVTPNASDSWGDTLTTTVDFGDGSGAQTVSGGQISHVYSTPGIHTATTTTADVNGYAVKRTQTVQVATSTAPSVTLTATTLASSGSLVWVWPDEAGFALGAGANRWEIKSAQFYPGDGTPPTTITQDTFGQSYAHPGTYTAKIVTTDMLDRTSTASTTVTVGDEFIPKGPARAFDSRNRHVDSVPAHGTVQLPLSLFGDAYPGVDGVGVTVTVTDTKASGYVTVYPDRTTRPTSSTLNFVRGQTVANSLLASAGSDGEVDFYNGSAGPIDLIVDTFGYQMGSASNSSGDTYGAVGPVRVLDTRYGTGAAKSPVSGGGSVTVTVGGHNSVPASATAVVLNVTTTDTKTAGALTAYGDGYGNPGTSNSNWAAGQTVSNLVVVPVTDGKVVLSNGGTGTVDFVADLVGYYQAYAGGSVIMPTGPTRILDTRYGTGTGGHITKLGARTSIKLHLAGLNGVPLSAVAAELNLTVTDTTGAGFISAYPDGTSLPNASSLNFAAGQTVANAAITPVGPDGSIVLYNGGNTPVDLIVDLNGTFAASS